MRRTLLLADDNVTVRRVIELTFSGEDVTVITVADGEQAMAGIAAERPDIVLAAIALPKRNGYEVASFVKDHPDLSHIPVLLVAGAFEPIDAARAKQVRCDGVLVKPLEPQQVIARVRQLVDSRAADGEEALLANAATEFPAEPPASESEPRLPAPELGVAGGTGDTVSLDDYFDRLDAAFATLGNAPDPPPPAVVALPEEGITNVPTLDDVLGGPAVHAAEPAGGTLGRVAPPPLEPADASPTLSPSARAHSPADPDRRNAVAEAFTVLFAIEEGEADPSAIRIGPPASAAIVTDELVDQITRRVLERLAPDAAKSAVTQVVSEVAERLVREEIQRIRGLR